RRRYYHGAEKPTYQLEVYWFEYSFDENNENRRNKRRATNRKRSQHEAGDIRQSRSGITHNPPATGTRRFGISEITDRPARCHFRRAVRDGFIKNSGIDRIFE